jgi:hypothetical protein
LTAGAVPVVKIQRHEIELHAGHAGGTRVRTTESAHPYWKTRLDFDQPRPAVFFAGDVRAPVLDEFYPV